MISVLLALILTSQGTPARAVDSQLVIVEGRPGCTAHALYGDPRRPVVVCK